MKYKKIVLLMMIAVIVFVGLFWLKGSRYRSALVSNPIAQHFSHSYASLRKMSDVFFLPYLLTESEIPQYYLRISLDNIARLNKALSLDPMTGILRDENKVFVSADFRGEGYDDRVKVRYRGRSAVHWNSLKKSLRVKFPDGNYLEGQKRINFIVPYDRLYFVEPLNMYRAKKLGLIDLEMHFSRININGSDTGVYLTFEQWSPEFLAKRALPESPVYRNRDEEVHIPKYTEEQYENFFSEDANPGGDEISAFLELLLHSDDSAFKKLIPEMLDMEKFYGWNIVNVLAGSNHQDEANNTILYFNNVTGKFEIIPWDIHIGDGNVYDDTFSVLTRRILSVPEFKDRRDEILKEYLKDDVELKDDLVYYDGLMNSTKKGFYKDFSKFHTNLKFIRTVKEYRDLIEENWSASKNLLESPPLYKYSADPDISSFAGSFETFSQLADSRDVFLVKNPSFSPMGYDGVRLSGTIILRNDTILPPNIRLKIDPGTTIYMDSGASLVVRGPVSVDGTSSFPVTIARYNQQKAWGTFLVLNSDVKSSLRFLNAKGGSGDLLNGVLVSGMVAFHNSDVDVFGSTFVNAKDDDALNIKMASGSLKNSYFALAQSDGFDGDYLEDDFVIEDNVFENNGGDSIDISFSDIKISGNKIVVCGDKGISVGEMSNPMIEKNSVSKCATGIAVKDLSNATVRSNVLSNNNVAIALYKKKDEFGGAEATIINNTLTLNKEDYYLDELSEIYGQ